MKSGLFLALVRLVRFAVRVVRALQLLVCDRPPSTDSAHVAGGAAPGPAGQNTATFAGNGSNFKTALDIVDVLLDLAKSVSALVSVLCDWLTRLLWQLAVA